MRPTNVAGCTSVRGWGEMMRSVRRSVVGTVLANVCSAPAGSSPKVIQRSRTHLATFVSPMSRNGDNTPSDCPGSVTHCATERIRALSEESVRCKGCTSTRAYLGVRFPFLRSSSWSHWREHADAKVEKRTISSVSFEHNSKTRLVVCHSHRALKNRALNG